MPKGGEEGKGLEGAVVVDEVDEDSDDAWDVDESHNVVTLGDMHVVKELQIANQNLRARLEAKGALLRQREMQLQAAKRAYTDLQDQNARLKEKIQELESGKHGEKSGKEA